MRAATFRRLHRYCGYVLVVTVAFGCLLLGWIIFTAAVHLALR